MLDYIIQALLFQTLFLAVYDLLLKRETFFQWNRAYLILTSILAYIIPLVKFENVQKIVPQEYIVMLPEVVLSPTKAVKQNLDWSSVLFVALQYLFWLGIIVTSILFLVKLYKILQLISNNEKENKGNYLLVLLENNTAFSFFKYIFLGKATNNENKQQIITHELIHVQQKHSLDLLLFEAQRIVCWFNPFSYIYQQRISELHEFIADSKAIKQNDKTSYFNSLLAETFGAQHISFINPFFKHSLIKKRIVMLHKNKSKQFLKLKYLLLVPVTAIMVLFVSNTIAQENNSNEKKKKSYKLSLVKKSPIYPSCESLTSQFEIRKCLSESITNHFNENFDFDIIKKLNIKTGKKWVSVFFSIEESGEVSQISAFAQHKSLEKEAIRVLNMLPKMIPGRRKGKTVGVRYGVSIDYSGDKIKIKSSSGPY